MSMQTPMHRPSSPSPLWKHTEHTSVTRSIKAFLSTNQEETLTASDIEAKFGYPAQKVHTLLRNEVGCKRLIRTRNDEGEYEYSYAKKPEKPTFDPSKVKLLDNKPIPEPQQRQSEWAALLQRMKPGQCTEPMPLHTLKAAERAMREAHQKTERRYTRRSDTNAGTYSVWRTK